MMQSLFRRPSMFQRNREPFAGGRQMTCQNTDNFPLPNLSGRDSIRQFSIFALKFSLDKSHQIRYINFLKHLYPGHVNLPDCFS